VIVEEPSKSGMENPSPKKWDAKELVLVEKAFRGCGRHYVQDRR
jgi:hypothetical protein